MLHGASQNWENIKTPNRANNKASWGLSLKQIRQIKDRLNSISVCSLVPSAPQTPDTGLSSPPLSWVDQLCTVSGSNTPTLNHLL